MKSELKVWVVCGLLIAAGAATTAVGAVADVVAVHAALPAVGSALIAAGLAALIVRVQLGENRQ